MIPRGAGVMLEQAESRSRVLVVDDEPDIRELIGLVLDATALEHEDVGDGITALERMKSEDYGSVVLDLMMPGMDGFAVLGALRSARPEVLPRVIVLTGGTPELLSRVDSEVFGVLRKPVVLRELIEAVRRCIDQNAN